VGGYERNAPCVRVMAREHLDGVVVLRIAFKEPGTS
jgi:hypothetical protein